MQYEKTILLKNGKRCLLRPAEGRDAEAVYALFVRTHGETDYLASYPEENTMTVEGERAFLERKAESPNEVQILACVDGETAGLAGISAIGSKEKLRHRAEFGISVEKKFWGMGIGRALAQACIECAKEAGYAQVELDVVAENQRAVRLYESLGFREYGRNPMGFRSRYTGWQALSLMRLELDWQEQ